MPWTSRPLRPLFDNVVCHYQVLKKLTSSSNSCCWRRKKIMGYKILSRHSLKSFFLQCFVDWQPRFYFLSPFLFWRVCLLSQPKRFIQKFMPGCEGVENSKSFALQMSYEDFFLFHLTSSSRFQSFRSLLRLCDSLTVRLFKWSIVWLFECLAVQLFDWLTVRFLIGPVALYCAWLIKLLNYS